MGTAVMGEEKKEMENSSSSSSSTNDPDTGYYIITTMRFQLLFGGKKRNYEYALQHWLHIHLLTKLYGNIINGTSTHTHKHKR